MWVKRKFLIILEESCKSQKELYLLNNNFKITIGINFKSDKGYKLLELY